MKIGTEDTKTSSVPFYIFTGLMGLSFLAIIVYLIISMVA